MAPTEMSKSGRMQVGVTPSSRTGRWFHMLAERLSAWRQRWRAGKRQD